MAPRCPVGRFDAARANPNGGELTAGGGVTAVAERGTTAVPTLHEMKLCNEMK